MNYKIDTIALLTSWPLSEDFIQKFDFTELNDLGFEWQIIDVSPLMNLSAINRITHYEENKIGSRINSYEELREILNKINDRTVFIDFINATSDINKSTQKIYRILKNYNVRLFVIEYGAQPDWVSPNHIDSRLTLLLHRITQAFRPKYLGDLITRKTICQLRRRNLLYPLPHRVFCTSQPAVDSFLSRLGLPNFIFRTCHSLDYSHYLKRHRSGNFVQYVKEKYCVFFWPNIINAPDLAISKTAIKPLENYHVLLNNLFDRIERELGVEVVLSVHPKSGFEGMPNPFNRKVFKGKSLDLIAHCEFAITHGSTAVNFPVIMEKPILFIVTDDILYIPEMVFSVPAMAKALNSVFVNLDHDEVDFQKVTKPFNTLKPYYDNYKKLYTFSEENKNMTNWEILTREIKNLEF